MKRSVAVVLGTAFLAAACGRGSENGRILASGHVEATEVLISTKVAGTLEHLSVDPQPQQHRSADLVSLGLAQHRIRRTADIRKVIGRRCGLGRGRCRQGDHQPQSR